MYSADCTVCTVCTVEASLPPMDSWTHGLLDAGCRREDADADAANNVVQQCNVLRARRVKSCVAVHEEGNDYYTVKP